MEIFSKIIRVKSNSGMNYEYIKKGKIYENYKGTEQLNKGTLFRNTENKKRYYDDINE